MTVIDIAPLITTDIMRPARYLGNEFGATRRQWESATVRWILTYPELYEVGASNSGHIILYNILNAQPRQLCDRTYLPGTDLITRLRAEQLPLFAVESRREIKDFDIVGFSLAYELGGTNILEMLDLSGIPLTWAERQDCDISQYPLIFAGGPTATSNPEPFAEFFDFFVLGDGEEVLPEIGLVIEDGKSSWPQPSRAIAGFSPSTWCLCPPVLQRYAPKAHRTGCSRASNPSCRHPHSPIRHWRPRSLCRNRPRSPQP